MSGRLRSPKAEELVSVAPETHHRVAPEPHCGLTLSSNSCRRGSTPLSCLNMRSAREYARKVNNV